MAVTIAIVKRTRDGNTMQVIADVTGPASYTTGGETLTVAQQIALMPEVGQIAAVDFTKVTFCHGELDGSLRGYTIDKANNKIVHATAGAQTANATNLSAVVNRIRLVYGGAIG